MESYKIKHFQRDNPGLRYPVVKPLLVDEVAHVAKKLAPLASRVYDAEPLDGVDANIAAFKITEVLAAKEIRPDDLLLLSFDSCKSIDEMLRDDVDSYFGDIWYPISDNLLVFDRTALWLMFVHHDGLVYLLSRTTGQ